MRPVELFDELPMASKPASRAFGVRANAAEASFEELHGPGAIVTRKFGIATGQIGADYPALAVGQTAQGQIARLCR